MLKIEELKKWCWENLEFYNCPDDVDDTYVTDIINGYRGDCYTNKGEIMKYWQIRDMFSDEGSE